LCGQYGPAIAAENTGLVVQNVLTQNDPAAAEPQFATAYVRETLVPLAAEVGLTET